MIVLPWFIRFGLDCTVALTPIYYLHHHPTTFLLEYFQNRRRLVRRQSPSDFPQLNQHWAVSQEEVIQLFKELNIEQ